MTRIHPFYPSVMFYVKTVRKLYTVLSHEYVDYEVRFTVAITHLRVTAIDTYGVLSAKVSHFFFYGHKFSLNKENKTPNDHVSREMLRIRKLTTLDYH